MLVEEEKPVVRSEVVDVIKYGAEEFTLAETMEYINSELEYMIRNLESAKLQVSAKTARYLAILITDLEKVYAFQKTFLSE